AADRSGRGGGARARGRARWLDQRGARGRHRQSTLARAVPVGGRDRADDAGEARLRSGRDAQPGARPLGARRCSRSALAVRLVPAGSLLPSLLMDDHAAPEGSSPIPETLRPALDQLEAYLTGEPPERLSQLVLVLASTWVLPAAGFDLQRYARE